MGIDSYAEYRYLLQVYTRTIIVCGVRIIAEYRAGSFCTLLSLTYSQFWGILLYVVLATSERSFITVNLCIGRYPFFFLEAEWMEIYENVLKLKMER